MTTFRAGAATDKGRVRSNNQDSKLVVEGRLFAVADGMGGHRGGEVASAVALESLEANLSDASTQALLTSVALANESVFTRAAADPELRGMGTTLCAVALVQADGEERLAVVNVGDSRIYRLRGTAFEQLTEDHSLVESLVRQGRLSATEAESHPQRNILTRALGIDARVEVDSWEFAPVTGDRYLLCSDGLFNEVPPERIAATLTELTDPVAASEELVRLANDGGGRDNITCVVVDVVDGPGDPATPVVRTTTASEPDLAGYGASEPTAPAPAPAAPPPAADTTSASVFGDDAPPPKSQTAQQPAIGVIGPEQLAEADEIAFGSPDPPARPKSKKLTWRVVVFVVALLALLGVVLAALWWYGNNAYYVDFNGDEEVTVFRGQPGGFLIWNPEAVGEPTGITKEELRETAVADVDAQPDFSSQSAAEDFVASLCDRLVPSAESPQCTGSEGEPEIQSTPSTAKPNQSTATTKP